MNPQTVQATFGCLLHDVGKAVCRAGISDGRHGEAGYRFVRDIDGYGQAKAVLDCIRYHHAAQLRQAKDCDPLAAIACIADNIAAAADRRQTGDETQFDRYLPLSPVFTHLNGEHPGPPVCSERYIIFFAGPKDTPGCLDGVQPADRMTKAPKP